jgi:hypothetical protein
MTNILPSPPQTTKPIQTSHPSGYGGTRPATTRPAFARRRNVVLSMQKFRRTRLPIDKNGAFTRHPAFAPIRDIENPSIAAPKSS